MCKQILLAAFSIVYPINVSSNFNILSIYIELWFKVTNELLRWSSISSCKKVSPLGNPFYISIVGKMPCKCWWLTVNALAIFHCQCWHLMVSRQDVTGGKRSFLCRFRGHITCGANPLFLESEVDNKGMETGHWCTHWEFGNRTLMDKLRIWKSQFVFFKV